MTDHRMVVSISPRQTVLWDQVQYTGNPSEFAWVLPVRAGTRIELARDAWISTLDLATRPSVTGPSRFCGGSGGGGGCGSSDMSMAGSSGSGNTSSGDASFKGGAGVEVVGQAVVGPYETVTVRSKNGEAIHLWLRLNGFAIPDNILPILAHYTDDGFDFLALRLRPDQGVQSMRPVRVVMPGAGATLPLRMVAAGIGAQVGLTLFVISEARHQAKNFPNAVIDRRQLLWDGKARRSNYRELMDRAFAETGGRGWVTEYAGQPFFSQTGGPLRATDPSVVIDGIAGTSSTRPLDEQYRSSCRPTWAIKSTCSPSSTDAGRTFWWDANSEDASRASDAEVGDGSVDDASGDDANVADGGWINDSGARPPPSSPVECEPDENDCSTFDDAEVALAGLHAKDVWLTRLRAELSAEACASGDLELEPAQERSAVPATMKTETFSDPADEPCPGNGADSDNDGCACGTTSRRVDWAPIALALAGLAVVFRKRHRRR